MEGGGFWEVLADLLVSRERRLRFRSYQGIRKEIMQVWSFST